MGRFAEIEVSINRFGQPFVLKPDALAIASANRSCISRWPVRDDDRSARSATIFFFPPKTTFAPLRAVNNSVGSTPSRNARLRNPPQVANVTAQDIPSRCEYVRPPSPIGREGRHHQGDTPATPATVTHTLGSLDDNSGGEVTTRGLSKTVDLDCCARELT